MARDNTVAYAGLTLQLPPSPARAHYVKAKVKVRRYPDDTLAVFHGPRFLARYDAVGQRAERTPFAGCRVNRFDAQSQALVELWTAAARPPTSPTSQQQQQTEADI